MTKVAFFMAGIKGVEFDLTVVVGEAHLRMGDFLRMGRGRILRFDDARSRQFTFESPDLPLTIKANGAAVGTGHVAVRGADVGVTITKLRPEPA